MKNEYLVWWNIALSVVVIMLTVISFMALDTAGKQIEAIGALIDRVEALEQALR